MTASAVEVWRSRHVLGYLVRRDLALKYQQSFMGYLWSLLEPLGIGAIYYFIFIVVIGRASQLADPALENQYILYLMSGIFSYMWTAGTLTQATGALTAQKALITTMKVPREVFPVGKVFARSAEFLAGLPILALIAIWVGAPFTWRLLLIPVAMAVQAIFLIGVALALSSLNVMMRDIERFMSMISRLVFYSAPVLYPLALVEATDRLPQWAKVIYMANPLVGIIELHHSVWFAGLLPSTGLLVTCLTGCLATLLAGWLVFRRLEPALLKEL